MAGQELLTLRHAGLEPRPRLAIVMFCVNDLREVQTDFAYGKSKARFVMIDDELKLTNAPVPWNFFERNCQLFCAVRKHLVEWSDAEPSQDESNRARRLTLLLHREMAAELKVIDGRLLVVAQGSDWLAQDVPGMHFLDLTAALEQAQKRAPIAFAVDHHWNAHGHRAVAEAIAAFVTANRLLR